MISPPSCRRRFNADTSARRPAESSEAELGEVHLHLADTAGHKGEQVLLQAGGGSDVELARQTDHGNTIASRDGQSKSGAVTGGPPEK